MSIFDTPPPIINKDNLLYWLEKNYDLFKDNILNSYKLNSERDYNLMILTKNNNKFVIKISNSSENYKILQLQDNLLKFLSKSIVSKNIPKIIHKHINIS